MRVRFRRPWPPPRASPGKILPLRVRQKLADMPDQLWPGGLLAEDQVVGAVERHEARALDEAGEDAAGFERDHRIVAAVEDQRGNTDLAQQVADVDHAERALKALGAFG